MHLKSKPKQLPKKVPKKNVTVTESWNKKQKSPLVGKTGKYQKEPLKKFIQQTIASTSKSPGKEKNNISDKNVLCTKQRSGVQSLLKEIFLLRQKKGSPKFEYIGAVK